MGTMLRTGLNNRLIICSMVLLLLSACAIPQFTDKPFEVDPAVFYQTVKVISLEPLELPEMKKADQVRTMFESFISEKLKAAGFTVVPSEKYNSLFQSFVQQQGGLYDAVSGKRNDEKLKEIKKKTFEALESQYQINAVARLNTILTSASFGNCVAKWHGVKQDIESCSTFGGGNGISGRISALSLLIVVQNKDGKTLFMNAGGVQPATRLITGFFKGARFEAIAPDDLFKDEAKIRTAVEVALNPLVPKSK